MSADDHGSRAPVLKSSRLLVLAALPLLLLLVVPLGVLIARTSPTAAFAALAEPETLHAIVLSLWTSVIALLVTMIIGTPAAWWLARSRSSLARVADALVDLPMIVPPAVAGLALLLTLGRRGPIGAVLEPLGIQLPFTPAAVVIAQVFVASPFFIRAAKAGLESVQRDLVEAATLDGAVSWSRLRYILLPQALPALFAGAAMAWARALGEFGATIIFAGNLPGRTQTMPLAIYLGFETSLDRALVLSTLLIVLALGTLATARLLK